MIRSSFSMFPHLSEEYLACFVAIFRHSVYYMALFSKQLASPDPFSWHFSGDSPKEDYHHHCANAGFLVVRNSAVGRLFVDLAREKRFWPVMPYGHLGRKEVLRGNDVLGVLPPFFGCFLIG